MSKMQNATTNEPRQKSNPEEYDLVILGGGTGGTIAAWTFAGQGKRVASAGKIAVFMTQFEQVRGGPMLLILNFSREWNKWYRVLRHGKGFGLFDSVRHGLWLARGCA